MIRRRYGLLIALAVAATLGVAAGAGLFIAYSPLGDPAQASREQILRWLVSRDLGRESAANQAAISRRLEGDVGESGDLAASVEQLPDERRKMLWHNVEVLLGPWLLEKTDEYAQLPPPQRIAYLDRFLDRVEQWSKIGDACLKDQRAEHSASGESLSGLIAARVAECSRRAEPVERQRIGDFMNAVQARWVWRKLASFSLFGKPAKQ